MRLGSGQPARACLHLVYNSTIYMMSARPLAVAPGVAPFSWTVKGLGSFDRQCSRFIVDRGQVAQGGVPPARVVLALNKVEHRYSRFVVRSESASIEQFACDRSEDA